jgi:hypothetical protein
MCRRWGFLRGLWARFSRHRLDPRVMEFIREFFAKLSSSSLDSKQNTEWGCSRRHWPSGSPVLRGMGGSGERGKTKREERGSHGVAYLGRMTTAAAPRRGSGLDGGGPRWQQRSGSMRSTGKSGAWATRRLGACSGVGCSGGHSIRRNGAAAAHRAAALLGWPAAQGRHGGRWRALRPCGLYRARRGVAQARTPRMAAAAACHGGHGHRWPGLDGPRAGRRLGRCRPGSGLRARSS